MNNATMPNHARRASAPWAPLRAWVEGVGVLGPGLTDWPQAQAVLRGEQPFAPAPTALPAPDILPPAERRRASRIVKATLSAGLQAARMAGCAPAGLINVFASSGGDGYNCHPICELLASDDRQISPTRFHNSVHNAASGYWSIATGATPAAQVLAAYDASFAAGLLEAMSELAFSGQRVLLVAGDSDYPAPLHAKRPLADTSAIALVLAPAPSAQAVAALSLSPADALADGPATPLHALRPGLDAALGAAVTGTPPWRGLPLLAALLGTPGVAQCVDLEYLPPQRLRLSVCPHTPTGAAE